jgi:hypothetical protein
MPVVALSVRTPSARSRATAAEIRRGVARRAHRLGQAGAARVEPEVAHLLVDAQRAAHAGAREPATGHQPGAMLGLADVREHAQPPRQVAARVDRHDRDPGADRPADRGAEARLRERDDEAVGMACDGLVDHRAHALEAVHVGRPVRDEHVHLAGGRLHPVADDRPERARRLPVRDDDDADRVAVAGVRAGADDRGLRARSAGHVDRGLANRRRLPASGREQREHQDRQDRRRRRQPTAARRPGGRVRCRRHAVTVVRSARAPAGSARAAWARRRWRPPTCRATRIALVATLPPDTRRLPRH